MSVPLAKYLFSDNSNEIQDQEVLIVLTPHIVRMPSITAENLRTMAAGTDSNVRVYRGDSEVDTGAKAVPSAAAPRQEAHRAWQQRTCRGERLLRHSFDLIRRA